MTTNNKKKTATKKVSTSKDVEKKPAAKTKKVVAKKKEIIENKEQKSDRRKKVRYTTYEGHPLTRKEAKFIDEYIATGNIRQSVIEAGFSINAPGQYGTQLLSKLYIAHEIEYRMELEHEKKVASGQEVMEFFAAVMRGEVKDQFNLEAPLSERIKAGQELAKRTVDIANKIAGVKANGENEISIKLDWSRKHGD